MPLPLVTTPVLSACPNATHFIYYLFRENFPRSTRQRGLFLLGTCVTNWSLSPTTFLNLLYHNLYMHHGSGAHVILGPFCLASAPVQHPSLTPLASALWLGVCHPHPSAMPGPQSPTLPPVEQGSGLATSVSRPSYWCPTPSSSNVCVPCLPIHHSLWHCLRRKKKSKRSA